MRITYIKLENVAGISVGMSRDVLEIDFSKSMNKIVAIQARNGSGKSVLLSSLTPFAYTTALDERSSLPYITPKKNGYKEIHYQDGSDQYVIKHYFKASKDTHSVKSYFMKNDEELNENGNVTSFNALVEIHFGLTQEMMRLIRLGSNVNSFISLQPTKRKEYIGKLIEEIDLYMKIYKKINDDIRVVKTLLQANNTNLYNCHITDPVVSEDELKGLARDIKGLEQERDQIMAKLGSVEKLMRDHDINELRRKYSEAESTLHEHTQLEDRVRSAGLENVTVDQLIKRRSELTDQKVDTQAKINSLRITIDSIYSNIDRLETAIKKITSNNDVRSLVSSIENIRSQLQRIPTTVSGFGPIPIKSDELQEIVSKLQSFNQISKMIISLGNKPIEVYLRLKRDKISVDTWLKDQAKRAMSRISDDEVRSLLKTVFGDDSIIMPNCVEEYKECPYFRLNGVINELHSKMEEESYTDETLRYIQVISNNVDNILNELDRINRKPIPDGIKSSLTEETLYKRLEKHLLFFDLSTIQEYLSLIREYEVYCDLRNRLGQYEHQLAIYQQAGIDSYTEEIRRQRGLIDTNNTEISKLTSVLNDIQRQFVTIESQIVLVTRFNDSKKYLSLVTSTLESTRKILEPLESASTEHTKLRFQLEQMNNAIKSTRDRHRELETKLTEYRRLVDEGKRLNQKSKDLNVILEAVSTRKGIPVYYMRKYLAKIQRLSNELLGLIYGEGDFRLAYFNVTPETFEVPYVKNGRRIPDIKYASQSEIALGTMALSFALSKNATEKYNILLLDEIDAGLDEDNRAAFLKMLYMQMNTLNAEQVFIISHNLTTMTNVPMDCIRLSSGQPTLKLQNVIYE